MAVFKCKICGGSLTINDNDKTAVCDYCGTTQTLPRLDDEKRIQLYDRANYFRRENEFDKAMGIYEMILSEDNEDYEAYWGIVLCRYGIEYVKDPRTSQRIPTVNRSQFTSIFEDGDYLNAIKYSDEMQREIFKKDAELIDKIQKRILEISSKEEAFDVFICYKETDKLGNRTQDSVYAQDIYTALTKEGYKVFFARITLEDKLGSAYEPYIFAALNSAKVMLVVGTEKDNFNAVWVKNEWSRYLSLIKIGKEKTLIPVYRDISPYDMPEEFQYLQSQDMSKIGFMQDLVRGINKLVGENKPVVKETVVVNNTNTNANIAPLLKRAFMFLEDGEFARADQFCEQVLNLDPECAEAYLGKLMVDLKIRKQDDLGTLNDYFDENANFQKAYRFADDELKSVFDQYENQIDINIKEEVYANSIIAFNETKKSDSLLEIANFFKEISGYKDADRYAQFCIEKSEEIQKDATLTLAKAKMAQNNLIMYESAIELLEPISGWKEAYEYILICKEKIEEIKEKHEKARIELERQAEINKKEAEEYKKKIKKLSIIITPIVAFVLVFIILLNSVIIPNNKYNDAVELINREKYREAIALLHELDGYKDSEEKVEAIIDKITVEGTISTGAGHSVGLKVDGTVVAVGYNDNGQCDVSDWTDIVAISAGGYHTVGLKADGTVVAVGYIKYGQCDVSDWTDIVAISAGDYHTVGLKSDGTVVDFGYNENGLRDVGGWTDIIAISAGSHHTVGLKADGTVVATGKNDNSQCSVNGWTDIIAISAGNYRTAGLKSNGDVVVTGYNVDGQFDVSGWSDIVAVSVGSEHIVGLKSDGTVVAVGRNGFGQCDVGDWTDIVAISAGNCYTLGLKSDGTVVTVGYNDYGQCNVNSWTDIITPEK